MIRNRWWTSPIAGALALIVALTFVTPAAAADHSTAAPAKSRLSVSAEKTVAKLRPTRAAFAQTSTTEASSGASDGGSFIRSKTGVAAIVLMVAGAAYVGWSIGNDNKKVHSPIR